MSNCKVGAEFEKSFCKLLSEHGFWVHRISQNVAGQQPADVIAVKNGRAFLIDCKVCIRDVFTFERMEPNQRSAMDLWMRCGNAVPFFALQGSNEDVLMLDYQSAKNAEQLQGTKSVSLKRDRNEFNLISFERFLELYDR